MSLICLVNAHAAPAAALAQELAGHGHTTRTFAAPRLALMRGRLWRFGLYIAQLPMTGMAAEEFLLRLRRRQVSAPVLFLQQGAIAHTVGAVTLRSTTRPKLLQLTIAALLQSDASVKRGDAPLRPASKTGAGGRKVP